MSAKEVAWIEEREMSAKEMAYTKVNSSQIQYITPQQFQP